MSVMHNALSYLGQILLVAVLATVLTGSLIKDKRLRISGVSALLLLGLFFPISGLTFSQLLRSAVGDLSVLTLVIFTNILAQSLFNHNFLKSTSHNSLLLWVTLSGVAFYPLALGVSQFDPYRLGYAPVLMSVILCMISIYSWLGAKRDLAVIILIPLIAFNLHLLESDNLWDYLMDPILFIYAVIHQISSIFQRPRKWAQHMLAFPQRK